MFKKCQKISHRIFERKCDAYVSAKGIKNFLHNMEELVIGRIIERVRMDAQETE